MRVLDLRPPSYAGVGAQYVKGSILDAELVREALDDVAEVYHLAALPGMWTRCKKDFHAVNFRGTEIVLEAARQRGVSRFLHCSTESILFGASPLKSFAIDHVGTTPNEMPGVYTRSKLAAEQRALQAAASGFPVVIANPTMPIGPHYGNLTPPTLMLRYFINRRIQLYFDFVLNLVDVRDVAAGLLLAMERGQSGHRYILGGEAMSLGKVLDDRFHETDHGTGNLLADSSFVVDRTRGGIMAGWRHWSGCRVGLAPTGKRRLVTATPLTDICLLLTDRREQTCSRHLLYRSRILWRVAVHSLQPAVRVGENRRHIHFAA